MHTRLLVGEAACDSNWSLRHTASAAHTRLLVAVGATDSFQGTGVRSFVKASKKDKAAKMPKSKKETKAPQKVKLGGRK